MWWIILSTAASTSTLTNNWLCVNISMCSITAPSTPNRSNCTKSQISTPRNLEPLAMGPPYSCGLVAPGPPPGGTPVPSAGGQTGVSSLEATPALRTCICCSVTPSPSPPEPDICFAGFPRFWTGVFPGVSAGLHFPQRTSSPLAEEFY